MNARRDQDALARLEGGRVRAEGRDRDELALVSRQRLAECAATKAVRPRRVRL